MTSVALSHWLVLALVAAVQALLFWKARRLAGQDESSRLAALQSQFEADVRARARRGLAPDWLRYQSEADRLLELRDDRLRSLAAAALAVGLGGTLFALFVSVLVGHGSPLEPMLLVRGMGVSLLGSLSGVALNLVIILVYLPAAEDRFTAQSQRLFHTLETLSDQHPPQEAFTQTLREELSQIRQSLNTEFASALSTAITGFPQVVTKLGEHIDKLALVVEEQGKSIGGAVGDLTRCAVTVAQSSSRLQPAAERLTEATEVLVRMPQDLREVVDDTRNHWLTGLREQHEEHVAQLVTLMQQVEIAAQQRERQVLDAARELQGAVAEVRDAVGRIPDHLAAEVARTSSQLGTAFGREARDLTNELSDRLATEYEQLIEHVERNQQHSANQIGTTVQELLDKVSGTVEERLVANLKKVSGDLETIVLLLPESANRLAETHAELSKAQERSLEGWREVGRTTGEAVQKLVDADGHLHVAVDALEASAEHLERIARVTDGFEASVLDSHRKAVAEYMEGLDTMRVQMLDLLHGMQNGQASFEGILSKQSEFIRACIQQLMKNRQVATLQKS
jgi:methyl-accepting chemotaxis protein